MTALIIVASIFATILGIAFVGVGIAAALLDKVNDSYENIVWTSWQVDNEDEVE